MEKRIGNFRKKIFTGKQTKGNSQATSKSKTKTKSQTSTKDKIKALQKKPLNLGQKQLKNPYDEYDYFAEKQAKERDSAKMSVGKRSKQSNKKSHQSSFKEKVSSQKQPKNKNLRFVSKIVVNKNDQNLSLEKKMKISQNYPHQQMGFPEKPKRNNDLWKKEVEEINKILQNFESVSIM